MEIELPFHCVIKKDYGNNEFLYVIIDIVLLITLDNNNCFLFYFILFFSISLPINLKNHINYALSNNNQIELSINQCEIKFLLSSIKSVIPALYIKSEQEEDNNILPWTKYSQLNANPSKGKILGRLLEVNVSKGIVTNSNNEVSLQDYLHYKIESNNILRTMPTTISPYNFEEYLLLNDIHLSIEYLDSINCWQKFIINSNLHVSGSVYIQIEK